MNLIIYLGTWGLYPWFVENREHLVYPPDLEKFEKLSPYGKVFQCVNEDDQYLMLKYKDETFSVKPDLYKQVSAPKINFNDKVRLVEKPNAEVVINEIFWHSDRNEPMYFITIDGKKKSKRYWNCDFVEQT